jgi:hypothetical protein
MERPAQRHVKGSAGRYSDLRVRLPALQQQAMREKNQPDIEFCEFEPYRIAHTDATGSCTVFPEEGYETHRSGRNNRVWKIAGYTSDPAC